MPVLWRSRDETRRAASFSNELVATPDFALQPELTGTSGAAECGFYSGSRSATDVPTQGGRLLRERRNALNRIERRRSPSRSNVRGAAAAVLAGPWRGRDRAGSDLPLF